MTGEAISPGFTNLLRSAGADGNHATRFAQTGTVFSKVLPHISNGEVALMGAVLVPVPLAYFSASFRDIARFRRGPDVLSVGKFSDPPVENDLAPLRIDRKELQKLAGCRVGKCSLKLSPEMMNILRNRFAQSGATPELEPAFRNLLFFRKYRLAGTSGMIAYGDKNPPVQSSMKFLELLGQFAWLNSYSPALFKALQDSRPGNHPGVEEFFYWSKDSFGLKPLISMTHVMICTVMIDGRAWMIAASKQIYADHYLEASLSLTIAADQTEIAAEPVTAVAYIALKPTDSQAGLLH